MKIKIIKYKITDENYCYRCERDDEFLAIGATNWEEVDEQEYSKIRSAVYSANNMPYNKKQFGYVIFEEIGKEEIFSTANQVVELEEKRKREYKNKEKADKKRREIQKQERKMKQLEKLKKELENG